MRPQLAIPDTPLFVKTHDFLLWLIRHTQRFPKNLRHSYTQGLENLAFDFQEAILMANSVRGPARSDWLGVDRPPRRPTAAAASGQDVCSPQLLRLEVPGLPPSA
jgi:hypothetical protein